MKGKASRVVLVALLALAGACTTEKLAAIRVGAFTPTKYVERPWIGVEGPAVGYRDKKIDDRTYTISVRGSEVTA
jgi:hypothetical protein